jgi:hypothetical protein
VPNTRMPAPFIRCASTEVQLMSTRLTPTAAAVATFLKQKGRSRFWLSANVFLFGNQFRTARAKSIALHGFVVLLELLNRGSQYDLIDLDVLRLLDSVGDGARDRVRRDRNLVEILHVLRGSFVGTAFL